MFYPDKYIRQIDLNKCIGNKVNLFFYENNGRIIIEMIQLENKNLKGLNKINWYSFSCTYNKDILFKLPIYSDSDFLKTTIKEAYLIQYNENGRSDLNRYKTYDEYFNPERKKSIQERFINSKLENINRDLKADICFIFEEEDIEFISRFIGLNFPEEWYSECFNKLKRFKIKHSDICLDLSQAKKVIKSFEESEDEEYEEYFPVVIFDKGDKICLETVKDFLEDFAKDVSRLIYCNERYYVFGSRIEKERAEIFLDEIYNLNGKILSNQEWDW